MHPDYNYGDYSGNDDDDDDDDDGDEHITGLIVEPPIQHIQPPIYRSKYRKSVQEELSHNKYDHKTLGVMRVSLNKPDQFLRKNSGVHPKRPQVMHKHYRRPDYQHKLPAWEPLRLSKTSENSNNSRKSMKNFKKENILNVKNFQIQASKLHHASNQNNNLNDSKLTETSSVSGNQQYHSVKNHVFTESKRPVNVKNKSKYPVQPSTRNKPNLKNIETKISAEVDELNVKVPILTSDSTQEKNRSMKNLKGQSKGRYVTEEERAELLYGMKKKWDEMMRQFQSLPFLADTPPKAKRKAKMEDDLKQLEKDIDEIERHPHIYVYDDDNGNSEKKK